MLDVMHIDHARLTVRGDESRIPPAFERARGENRPFVFLVTRTPE
jgi:hypothetical protein